MSLKRFAVQHSDRRSDLGPLPIEYFNEYALGTILCPENFHPLQHLDIGSGTGHHVADLASKGFDVIGIDTSPSMVKKAQEQYPDYKFEVANALDGETFVSNSFTHIMCMYFTVYYFKDKRHFFDNFTF